MEKRKKMLTLSITDDEQKELKQEALKERTSVSQIIRWAIKSYIANRRG